MMRILYVWDAEYPWDVRTEKICLALTQQGHEVIISARCSGGRPRSERLPEGTIERLPSFRGWGGRLLSFPAFFNPFWISLIRRIVRERAVDLIIVRDLPLAPTALQASGGHIPVILDMAENYPAMIADIWTDGRHRAFDVLVRNPRLVAAVERYTLRKVTHTLTVVEESSDRLFGLGLPRDCATVVSNTPSKGRVAPLVPRSANEPMRIVYLGLMERHRGIADLLDAAHHLLAARVPYRLDLVGDGRDFTQFRAYASELGLNAEHVTFHGRLSHPKAIEVVGHAHVGIVPHHATPAWNTTISNKLFDYMAAGLAVVSSDAVPSARVTIETGAGLVYRSGDGQGLARAIQRFLDLEFWVRCRRAGQEAIRSHYNWETDTKALLEVVDGIGSNSAKRVH